MSNSIPEIEDTSLVFVFGYNAADSHPIVARRIVLAKEKGAQIIVVDPRRTEAARISDLWLPITNGSNMALVNACANVLIEEGLYDRDYVEKYTEGFEAYREIVSTYTPEATEKITGIAPELVRKAMRMYAAAPSAFILYGMGVTQFGQAVDVVKGLSGLALLTGNFGRPNVGIGPVRGQNNVQGTCDVGVLPNIFPGYQPVTDAAVREKFAKAWGVPSLPDKVGHMLTAIPHLVHEGKLKAFYIFGEDPAQTDPDLAGVREALESLELVIVQDIFMNKTSLFADVILPATAWGEHDGSLFIGRPWLPAHAQGGGAQGRRQAGLGDFLPDGDRHGLSDEIQQHQGDLGRDAGAQPAVLRGDLREDRGIGRRPMALP